MSGGRSAEQGVAPASFQTGLVTARLYESWAFYTEKLGFRTADEGDEWVRLVHPSGGRLMLLQEEADAPVSELVSAVEPRGFWLTLAVPEPGALAGELRAAGCDVRAAGTGGGWGAGTWCLRDPNGVMILLCPLPGAGTHRSRCGEGVLAV